MRRGDDNTTLVRKSLLTDRITTLGPEKMAAVCRALNEVATAIDPDCGAWLTTHTDMPTLLTQRPGGN